MKRTEKWQIKLKAEPNLLEKLSGEFCKPELNLFHDSDCWFLESSYLESDELSEIYSIGEKLIDYLNHTLWLYSYRPNPIESIGYYLLPRDGERVSKFVAIGMITVPTRLIVHSNDIPSRKSLDLFSQYEKVRESLALFNNAEIDWFTLFKIYETARDDDPDIPNTKDGIALIEMWCGIEDNKRFFETANWHRHSVFGKNKEKPNKEADNPMSLSEARRFIRKVLIAWLEHKLTIKNPTQSS